MILEVKKILTDQEGFSIDDIHTGTDLDFFNNNYHFNKNQWTCKSQPRRQHQPVIADLEMRKEDSTGTQ